MLLLNLCQVRCAGTLTTALTHRKRDLEILLPWRPLYVLLVSLIAEPTPRIDGELKEVNFKGILVGLKWDIDIRSYVHSDVTERVKHGQLSLIPPHMACM